MQWATNKRTFAIKVADKTLNWSSSYRVHHKLLRITNSYRRKLDKSQIESARGQTLRSASLRLFQELPRIEMLQTRYFLIHLIIYSFNHCFSLHIQWPLSTQWTYYWDEAFLKLTFLNTREKRMLWFSLQSHRYTFLTSPLWRILHESIQILECTMPSDYLHCSA